MIAKIRMANDTRSPICINGARALKIDFNTTCRPKENIFYQFEIKNKTGKFILKLFLQFHIPLD